MEYFARLYQKIGQENPEEKETFDDIAETLLKVHSYTFKVESLSVSSPPRVCLLVLS